MQPNQADLVHQEYKSFLWYHLLALLIPELMIILDIQFASLQFLYLTTMFLPGQIWQFLSSFREDHSSIP